MSKILSQATKIMLIRHAEKPSNSHVHGVTVEGKHEKESLSVRGWQRAGALASFFAPSNGTFQDSSIATPQYLYASKPIRHNGSCRSIETIAPLAEKLAVKINSKFAKFDYAEMLEHALTRKGVVLISWQRELIPKIANFILGDELRAPQNWSEDRFDLVWVFDRNSESDKYGFKQIPQNLLAGDLDFLWSGIK